MLQAASTQLARLTVTLLATLPLLLVHARASATVRAGTVLVAGSLPIGNPVIVLRGALFAVNPVSGEREVLSDFLDESQGPRGVAPTDVAVSPGGRILVLDAEGGTKGSFGAVFAVDRDTGRRTLVSDLSDPAQGPTGRHPEALAIGATGTIYVVDRDAGTGSNGAILAIDPFDGRRRLVSNYGNRAQGGAYGGQPFGLALADETDTILALDTTAIVRIDAATGARSTWHDQLDTTLGPSTTGPAAIVVTPDAVLLLSENFSAQTDDDDRRSSGGIFTIPRGGGPRMVSHRFTDPAGGLLVNEPIDLARSAAGTLYVVGQTIFDHDALVAIDGDGVRRLVSDFEDPAQGRIGWVDAVAVFPRQLDPCFDLRPTDGCTVNGRRNQACRGGDGNDRIVGTPGPDVVRAGRGDDRVLGLGGDDILCGEEGNDRINGGRGADRLYGGPHVDRLIGDAGADQAFGGTGADTCLAEAMDSCASR